MQPLLDHFKDCITRTLNAGEMKFETGIDWVDFLFRLIHFALLSVQLCLHFTEYINIVNKMKMFYFSYCVLIGVFN